MGFPSSMLLTHTEAVAKSVRPQPPVLDDLLKTRCLSSTSHPAGEDGGPAPQLGTDAWPFPPPRLCSGCFCTWRVLPQPPHLSSTAWPKPRPLRETSAFGTPPTLSSPTQASDHTFPGASDPTVQVLLPQATSLLHSLAGPPRLCHGTIHE